MTTNTEVAIWERIVEPENATLPPEAARCLLRLNFHPSDLERMNELAEKSREGVLTAAEEEELDQYIKIGHTLSLLKSKARKSLKHGD